MYIKENIHTLHFTSGNNTTLGLDGNMSSTSEKNSLNLNHQNPPIDINCCKCTLITPYFITHFSPAFRLCAAIIVIIFAVLHIALETLKVFAYRASYFVSLENHVKNLFSLDQLSTPQTLKGSAIASMKNDGNLGLLSCSVRG